jgi:hypothetical protein
MVVTYENVMYALDKYICMGSYDCVCVCVVGILMVVVFEHVAFALLPSYVDRSIILRGLEGRFHYLPLVEYFHVSNQ